MNNLLVGAGGEAYAQAKFEACGYEVKPTLPNSKQGDFRIKNPVTGEVMRVEIKTSRKGVKGWCVCLNKGKKTAARHADMVVLQLITQAGRVVCYFIPSDILANKQSISFRTADSPNSKWGEYRRVDYAVMGGVQ